MTTWINSMGTSILGWVLVGVGTVLVISAIAFGGMAIAGKEKQWGKFLENLAVGILGGLMLVWSAASLISFYKNKGQEIPHS